MDTVFSTLKNKEGLKLIKIFTLNVLFQITKTGAIPALPIPHAKMTTGERKARVAHVNVEMISRLKV